jgi:uncharacterized protein YndB with AHSA1/START domain
MELVERIVTLPTDLADAWELLTDPDELALWLGDDVRLDPTPGAAGRVLERDGSDRALVVHDVEPERRLSWTWWPEGGDPGAGSHVEITLSPADGGTLVRVVERPLAPQAATASATASALAWAHLAGDAWSQRLLSVESLLLLAAVRG